MWYAKKILKNKDIHNASLTCMWYAKKILKNKDIHNASLTCIIDSMPANLILFCEIWVLTPSFFSTSLRSHYAIFSPQIKQENWLTYCSMKIQNCLCDKLGIQFLNFFMSQYPLLFVDSIYACTALINNATLS